MKLNQALRTIRGTSRYLSPGRGEGGVKHFRGVTSKENGRGELVNRRYQSLKKDFRELTANEEDH